MTPVYGDFGPYGSHNQPETEPNPDRPLHSSKTPLEVLTYRHRALVASMWHCACGARVNHSEDHSKHVAQMIREAGYS